MKTWRDLVINKLRNVVNLREICKFPRTETNHNKHTGACS